MADRGDRLARVEEGLDELDGLRLHAQLVGVGDAAGQQQRVEVLRVGLRERHVNLELVSLVVVIPALHLSAGGRDDFRFRARVVERTARRGQLHLLEAFGDEYGDLLSGESLLHALPP